MGRVSADTAQKMFQQVAESAHQLVENIVRESNQLYNQTKPENAVGEKVTSKPIPTATPQT